MKAARRLDEETMEPVEIIEWLAGEECHALDEAGLAAGAGRRLRAAGLPLDWLSLHLRALHPEIVGRMHAWAASGPAEDREREFGFDQFASLADSPVRRVMDRGEWLRVRPAGPGNEAWRPFLDVFCRAGIAELLIAPLAMGSGPISAAAFGTQRPAGFAAAERALLERLLPSLRCACELRVLRRVEASLLDTYVGAASGRHILAGQIRRGEVEALEAALLLCDLRGFTALSNRLPTRRVLELLNRYFDQVVPAIADAGGEVLKFMGDAVLAFFHDEGGPCRSCLAAFAAARAALARLEAISEPDAELRAGIALHHGVVAYGNIGSGRRLDFTLIGGDVNLASRIEGVCAATGRPLLMSAHFARLADLPGTVSAGRHRVKGFEEPVELFAVASPTDERRGSARC
jgi:adenylate cyclase